MNTFKRENQILRSLGQFIVLQHAFKFFLCLLLVLVISTTSFYYYNYAFDYIEVNASHEQAMFDLKITSDDKEIIKTDLTTPFSMKVLRGEKISIEITDNTHRICGSLKSGFSSLKMSHIEKDIKMERKGRYLKGGCI